MLPAFPSRYRGGAIGRSRRLGLYMLLVFNLSTHGQIPCFLDGCFRISLYTPGYNNGSGLVRRDTIASHEVDLTDHRGIGRIVSIDDHTGLKSPPVQCV